LVLVETACIVICVVDADLTAINASVGTDGEVIWHERSAVCLENDVAFKEGTLRNSRINLFWLSDHNRLVLKVIEDSNLSDSVVFKAALNNMLLEVALEAHHLFVELNVCRLELLLNVGARS